MRDEIRERIEAVRRGEVPEGYRRTRAGIMPSEWDGTVKARDIFGNYTDKSHGGNCEVLSATQDRGIIPRNEVDIDIKFDEDNLSTYKKVDVGDFVISLRSFQGGIEYSEYEGIVSPAYTVLKAKREIDNGYYRAYFKTADFIKRLNGAVYGIRDGKQIGFEDFGDLRIHYPPLQEQRRIAEILDACDRLIGLKQKLIREKQKQKQWLASQILRGGHKRLLFGICPFICDGDWIESKDQSDAGIRLIQTGNVGLGTFWGKENRARFITEETFNRLHCTEVLAGDVLVSRLPDPIGRACLVPVMEGKAITAVDCTILRFNDDNLARYFVHYSTSREYLDRVEALSGGSTRSRISRKEIEKLTIPIPDSIEQIIEINNRLTVADKEIELLEKEVEAQYRLKKALMQLLLTGLVRVNA